MKINADLHTLLKDWQAIALRRSADADTPEEKANLLAESKRYGYILNEVFGKRDGLA